MKLLRGLGIHAAVLVVASGLAWKVWTEDEVGAAAFESRVKVWEGPPDKLESIRLESPERTVVVTPRSDAEGRYYEVRVDKEVPSKRSPAAPGAAGASGAEPEPAREKQAFIAVAEGEALATTVAPLMALRAVGRVEGDRREEFGFDDASSRVIVTVSGKKHELVIGGLTPGGGDRYARLQASGEVFAVPGDLVRRLEHAETRLLERNLHDFGEGKPASVRVRRGDASRNLVPVKGKVGGYADAETPAQVDDTLGNWMSKLGRLRLKRYVADESELQGAKVTLAVDYYEGTKKIGFTELSVRQDEGAKKTYFARTERTRWPVEVLASSAKDLDQDAATLFE